jgi:hypothetical protein
MNDLVLYERARNALAEAHRVDEVKDIRDKAAAMQAYAKQAKDRDLIEHATEIRLRAERKAGELLKETEKAKGARGTGSNQHRQVPSDDARAPTLADLGISYDQSSRWQKLAGLDDGAFEQRVSAAKRQAVASIEQTAAERMAEKQERRDAREVELAARQAALPRKRYGVIYADPEWRFEPYSRESGMDRAADNHYPTSELEEIKARDVASIAADDCVLFLWATAPMLPQALAVMAAWGFAYKTHFVWAKDRIGTGYWNRNRHELLLVGTRGDIPAPAMGTQADSLRGSNSTPELPGPGGMRGVMRLRHERVPTNDATIEDARSDRRAPRRLRTYSTGYLANGSTGLRRRASGHSSAPHRFGCRSSGARGAQGQSPGPEANSVNQIPETADSRQLASLPPDISGRRGARRSADLRGKGSGAKRPQGRTAARADARNS